MVMNSKKSSPEELWLDAIRQYILLDAKAVDSILLSGISEAKTHLKPKVSCLTQAKQIWKVSGRLGKLRLAA